MATNADGISCDSQLSETDIIWKFFVMVIALKSSKQFMSDRILTWPTKNELLVGFEVPLLKCCLCIGLLLLFAYLVEATVLDGTKPLENPGTLKVAD